MSARCTCPGCASGRHGTYVRLLHTAQADQDQAHRQQVWDALAPFAPLAGGSNLAADAAAAAVLARFYPEQHPPAEPAGPSMPPEIAAILAEGRDRTTALIAGYVRHLAGG